MVICLERGADWHMAQLMPLPLTVSCFGKIQIGFTFLVPAHLGSPGKGPLNGCVCVCVCIQNIDLHALTGWIPERVAIRRSALNAADETFNADREFQRIHERFHRGHCLVTVATGELRDGDADRAGLVPTHAYAMLDIQLIQVPLS